MKSGKTRAELIEDLTAIISHLLYIDFASDSDFAKVAEAIEKLELLVKELERRSE